MRLLLVEDSVRLRDTLQRGLTRAGYAVDAASDGRDGLWLASENEYDVIVLDLMLPQLDGWSVLRHLRESGNPTHVLVLSARDMVADRVRGLAAGADDYLVKPFAFDELCARIQALVRRSYRAKNPVLRVGELEIHTTAHQVRSGGIAVRLTPREYAVLEFLALRAGEVVSRRAIWEHLYTFDAEATSNVVDVLVCSLRRKLAAAADHVQTRRGEGYLLGGASVTGSLRGRLVVALLIGLGALLAGGGVLLERLIGARVAQQFDASLLVRARTLESLTEDQGGRIWLELTERVMPEFEPGAAADYYELWQADGRVLARSPSLAGGDLARERRSAAEPLLRDATLPDGRAGRTVELTFRPRPEIVEAGDGEAVEETTAARAAPVTLVVGHGRGELDALLRALRLSLVAVIVLLLLATALVVRGIVGAVLAPLAALARRLAGIDAASLGKPLPLSTAPAELVPVLEHLNGMLARLDASFAREQAFSANVAHELRTPLAELRAVAEVAMRWPDDGAAALAALSEARQIGLQMEAMVGMLLELARCESGLHPPACEPVALRPLLEDAWRSLASEAAARRITLDLEVPSTLVLESDRGKLALVLANLLGNAVAHGRAAAAITVRGEAYGGHGGELRLHLANLTGGALAATDLPHLYERFWRKDAARAGGRHAGLGLALVAALCEQLGLALDTRLADDLLTITLRGPLAAGAAAAQDPAPAAEVMAAGTSPR